MQYDSLECFGPDPWYLTLSIDFTDYLFWVVIICDQTPGTWRCLAVFVYRLQEAILKSQHFLSQIIP